MKITGIKQQVKRAGRYSIFVDDKYEFSLSDIALLDSKLTVGQELSPEQVKALKQTSVDDKLYNQTLNYLAIRPRSQWEIEFYLQRKKASPSLVQTILNKLSINKLINDEAFAKAFINDRRLLRPTSRRKIIAELRKKHVAEEVIQSAVGNEPEDEAAALRTMIERKRRQTKYRDDLKLMQYLARQGFNYGDIKAALSQSSRPD
jgi:regulatory protein